MSKIKKYFLFNCQIFLKSIGQINKSYELIERYDLSDDKNFNFYSSIKLNYFYQLFN